jgi:protein-S-isoprenylcysteine O-methyltransferase Ste14
MNTMDHPNQNPTKEARILSLWIVYPLAFFVWFVLPWAVSLIGHRYGWEAGRPGIWNLHGLILVLVGTLGLIWGISAHTSRSLKVGVDWEFDKNYLLINGLYAYSRNPMYVAELILMVGWAIFYGSISVLVALVVWLLFFNFYQIPKEEHILEAHFGDAYREYKRNVPRWLGWVRH